MNNYDNEEEYPPPLTFNPVTKGPPPPPPEVIQRAQSANVNSLDTNKSSLTDSADTTVSSLAASPHEPAKHSYYDPTPPVKDADSYYDDSISRLISSESIHEMSSESAEVEKKRRLKAHAMEEFIRTEQTYVTQLGQIRTVFAEPLRSYISERDHLVLFPPILTNIVALNTNFLSTLLTNAEEDPLRFSQSVLEFVPYFRMYEQYASVHNNITNVLRRLNRDSAFTRTCQQIEISSNLSTSLEGLLVVPIQRPTRYELLLSAILKYTREEEPDRAQLIEAYEAVNKLNKTINVGILENDRRQKVQLVGTRFGIDLSSPSRRFIRSGELTRVGRSTQKKYVFFLFNDCLLYGTGHTMRNLLQVDSSFSVERRNDPLYKNCFEIKSTEESFIVCANTEEEMETWLSDTKKVVKEHLRLGVTKRLVVSPHDAKRPAPVFVKRKSARCCTICREPFSVSLWRYNCQICGHVVCNNCLTKTMKNNKGRSVKACDKCALKEQTVSKLTRQIVNIKLPEEASVTNMRVAILLEDRHLKSMVHKATRVDQILKKACHLMEHVNPEDFALCIDDWNEYLAPEKLFADYFVFHQASNLSLDLSIRRKTSIEDFSESHSIYNKPEYMKSFMYLPDSMNFSDDDEDEEEELEPEKTDPPPPVTRQMSRSSTGGALHPTSMFLPKGIQYLPPKFSGIYLWRGAMYQRPLYECKKNGETLCVYFWKSRNVWVLCKQTKIHTDDTIAYCQDPNASHPVETTRPWYIRVRDSQYTPSTHFSFEYS